MTLLRLERLDLRHGPLQAVRQFTIDLDPGEVLALVGANGAGKTTLLRAIAGAHRPFAGRILLGGRDITDLAAHQRVREGIALAPEGRRLFADLTVEENLLLGRSGGRAGDWSLDRIFDAFPNLAARRRASASSLSGGEQQATAIGRALMSNPDLLLLDEVSLGLSPLAVDRVYASLRELLRSGVTVILVEQDLGRAMAVSNRIVCMLEGRAVLDRPAAEASRDEITAAYFGLRGAAREFAAS